MKTTIRKRRLIDTWRIGETESWLIDMAAQGLHLCRVTSGMAYFEEDQPGDIRYRLDVGFSWPSDEKREMFREGGWRFVCHSGGISVYRSPASSNAPELHTDAAEQALTLRKLNGKVVLSAIVAVVCLIAALCMRLYALHAGDTPVLDLIEGRHSGFLTAGLLLLYMMVYHVRAVVSMAKLIRSMREGRPIDHHAPWKRHQRRNIVALWVMIGVLVVSQLIPMVQLLSRRTEPLPSANDGVVLLRLVDIEQNPVLERLERPDDDGNDRGNQIQSRWSAYAPVQIQAEESGIIRDAVWPGSNVPYMPTLRHRRFVLTLPWLANGLIDDLAHNIGEWNQGHGVWYPMEEMQAEGLDRLAVRDSGDFIEVFAHKNHTVVYAQYAGVAEVQAVVDGVVALFTR